MIQEITIENYKSIQSLSIELGRVTVFIGENGCGKSNILEAIALGSAAAADKLDNEFLASRGIRVTDPKLMRSAFDINNLDKEIKISFKLQNVIEEEIILGCLLNHDNDLYSSWSYKFSEDSMFNNLEENITKINTMEEKVEKFKINSQKQKKRNISSEDSFFLPKDLTDLIDKLGSETAIEYYLIFLRGLKAIPQFIIPQKRIVSNFLLFGLELTELKEFSKEGQIEPLGIQGQGLFKYLRYLSQPQFKEKLDEIKEKLELIDWFEDFEIPDNLYPGEKTLKIKDRYLDPDLEYFDQKSANEGFLFLLFYFCLFIGEETPKFFAIDNIDSSLNPRLCRRLIQELVELAKKYDKQVILTTHNPSVLDGLDLDDQEQKLYVIKRKRSGQTRAIQIFTPKPLPDQEPVPLSEAFLRGYIGGLPKNF
jgi:AAA15 family ATPase/GTPase